MATSQADTVEDYLSELATDRREAIEAVRATILENLPDGYEETMQYGMVSYIVPFSRLPETYNGEPLAYVSLASQKNHMSLYLMGVYGDFEPDSWFQKAYRASGKKLDMGKSCVRFRKLDDLPLDVIGEAVARTSVDDFVAAYERSRGQK